VPAQRIGAIGADTWRFASDGMQSLRLRTKLTNGINCREEVRGRMS